MRGEADVFDVEQVPSWAAVFSGEAVCGHAVEPLHSVDPSVRAVGGCWRSEPHTQYIYIVLNVADEGD